MTSQTNNRMHAWIGNSLVVYCLLTLAWGGLMCWQAWEHARVEGAAAEALADQARDRAAAFGVVMRSQGRFGVVPQSRLEAALNELVDSSEVLGVTLLNVAGEVTAEAGEDGVDDYTGLLSDQNHWRDGIATFVNLIALGPNTGRMLPGAVVIPEEQEGPRGDGPFPRGPGPGPRGRPGMRGGDMRGPGPRGPHGPGHPGPPPMEDIFSEAHRELMDALTDGQPVTEEEFDRLLELLPAFMRGPDRDATLREDLVGKALGREGLRRALDAPREPGGPGGPGLRRPPWLGPSEYDMLVEKRGVHWFVVTLPDTPYVTEVQRDLRARFIVAAVALLACSALALAWRAVRRTGALEVELVRAGENARHLRELNMAAAGLVHETKNPLNLIRGMAQMIARSPGVPEDLGRQAVRITDEADRVTGRLNKFLDYSRPPAPQMVTVDLGKLAREVCDILGTDAEDRTIDLSATGEATVRADAGMLRQVLFNLTMNALQAVPEGGRVQVCIVAGGNGTVDIEVIDNGPGVPADQREEVFRPYFTTAADGTGLGLAVVRQIVSAHGWSVRCEAADGGGACFRVSGIARAQGSEAT